MTALTNDPKAIGPEPRVMPGLDLPNVIAGHILLGSFSIGMLIFVGWIWKVAAGTGFQMPFFDENGDMGWALFAFGNVFGIGLAGLFLFFWWVIFKVSQTRISVGPNGVCVKGPGSVYVCLWDQIVRVNKVTLVSRPKGGAAGAVLAAMDYDVINHELFRSDGEMITADEKLMRLIKDKLPTEVPWTSEQRAV
ncbi:MAG: hypothetical protein AAF456_21145 [Planctomycetota bacterium]